MLSDEELKSIPRSTLYSWKKFKHTDYVGYEIVKDYLKDFDDIKSVFQKKYFKKTVKFIGLMSYGYNQIIKHVEKKNKIKREYAENITYSIKKIASHGKITTANACKILGVSRNWYYQHRIQKICPKNFLKKCFSQYPKQLTYDEINAIESIIHIPENHGKTKTTLYYSMLNNNLLFCSKSTFFKYTSLLGYQKFKKIKINTKKIGFRASRPFECLHIDITNVQTVHDGIQKVAFVKDNFSKALLHGKTIPKVADSLFISQLLHETFEKYDLYNVELPVNIVSDGGSENKGEVLDWIDSIVAPPCVTKITAKTEEFPFSNSMSESTHSIFKSEFMKGKISVDVYHHELSINNFMLYFNYHRYPTDLFGYTPIEVLNGKIPDKHLFKESIREANIARYEKNRGFNQCKILCKIEK
jgi:hypothetical protein